MEPTDATATATVDSPAPSVDWVDIVATVVMAIAALLTAWSAFQSDQWSDTMSFSLSEAAAARTESARSYARAGQLSQVDVMTFIAWLEAARREYISGGIDVSDGYQPDPVTHSGILYVRFGPGFRSAMDSWLETGPLSTPDAPANPFVMAEYQLPEAAEAERLAQLADDKVAGARAADEVDDQYVLSTVMFAGIFLFAGLSTKMRPRAPQFIMLGFSLLLLITGAGYLLAVPIQV
ncbi:MAG: hypothetical protein R6X29_10325 [Acidimicrobiia bacterium]|jgi:hypothetical protein